MTRLLLILLLMGLAQAQELELTPFAYQGVVQQVTPGGVWLQTSDGLNVMLPQGLDFEVGGTRVEVGSLVPGNPCSVLVPAGPAQVVAVQGDLCTLMLPTGPCQVPVSVLPADALGKGKVSVLKNNGKVVQVPLNAALNMQRSQGARILGAPGLSIPRWTNGAALEGVVCGYQGDDLLLVTAAGGLLAVPSRYAPSLAPGRPIFVPGGPDFKVQNWVPGYKAKGGPVKIDVGGPGNSGKGNGGKGNPGKGKNKIKF
ncbi:MAG: hypothetical protein AMXMBFR33_64320 [Candidatus Xenobia bacterium]|jgi:hypothetical protein